MMRLIHTAEKFLSSFSKLMKSTNEPISNLLALPAEGEAHTPCEKIFIEFSLAYERYV